MNADFSIYKMLQRHQVKVYLPAKQDLLFCIF